MDTNVETKSKSETIEKPAEHGDGHNGKRRRTEMLPLEKIEIGKRLRRVDDAAIDTLGASIAELGLHDPITVRKLSGGDYRLITGATRLAAFKKLGRSHIDCFVKKCDDATAILLEITENFHRSELTVLERSNQFKLYAETIKSRGISAQVGSKSRGRPAGGINEAARQLGLSRSSAQRSIKVATELTPEAKETARAVGLANDQTALLKATGASPEDQPEVLREIAESKRKEPFPRPHGAS